MKSLSATSGCYWTRCQSSLNEYQQFFFNIYCFIQRSESLGQKTLLINRSGIMTILLIPTYI